MKNKRKRYSRWPRLLLSLRECERDGNMLKVTKSFSIKHLVYSARKVKK